MKKLCILLAAVMCTLLTACGDDNGVMEYHRTYVKYKLDVGSDFLSYYNVEITYADLEGNKKTITLTETSWDDKDDRDGDHNIVFYYDVKATLRTPVPAEFTKDRYNMGYSYGIYWFQATTGAKSYAQDMTTTVNKADMAKYLASRPEVNIAHYTGPQ